MAIRSRQFDIEQRTKLIELSTHKTPPRNEVIEELINEKLKIQLAEDASASRASTRTSTSLRQHGAAHAGDAEAVHRESRQAGRQGRNAQVPHQGRPDLGPDHPRPIPERASSSATRKSTPGSRPRSRDDENVVGYDYTLRPILFVVPRGSPPAAFEAAPRRPRRCAAAFRAATRASRIARGMRDVAVRTAGDQKLRRPAAAVARRAGEDRGRPADRAGGDRSRASRSTRCAASSKSENGAGKKEVRDEMFNEAFETALQEVPQGTARSSHDRIPVGLRRCRDRWR